MGLPAMATIDPDPDNVVELPAAADSPTPSGFLPREGKLWLVAAVIMFLTGLFKGINLLVLLAYLLLGIWILNWRIVRSDLRRVRGKRVPNATIFAGIPSDCTIVMNCEGTRVMRGLLLADRGDDHDRQWLISSLKPGEVLRIRRSEVFHKRGRYRSGVVRATSRFPFGLVSRSVEVVGNEEWVVLPRIGRVHVEYLKQWLARTARGDGRMRKRQFLPTIQEADFHGLREYRRGDSPRWIHWRTSARRDQLLVCEFEESSPPDLVLVVEPAMPAQPSPKDRDRLENVISLASTIIHDWCRDLSLRLTFIVARKEAAILPQGSGADFALQALQILAVEEGTAAVSASTWLPRLPRSAASSPVLVLSSLSESKLVDELSATLGRAVASADVSESLSWYDPPLAPVEASR